MRYARPAGCCPHYKGTRWQSQSISAPNQPAAREDSSLVIQRQVSEEKKKLLKELKWLLGRIQAGRGRMLSWWLFNPYMSREESAGGSRIWEGRDTGNFPR